MVTSALKRLRCCSQVLRFSGRQDWPSLSTLALTVETLNQGKTFRSRRAGTSSTRVPGTSVCPPPESHLSFQSQFCRLFRKSILSQTSSTSPETQHLAKVTYFPKVNIPRSGHQLHERSWYLGVPPSKKSLVFRKLIMSCILTVNSVWCLESQLCLLFRMSMLPSVSKVNHVLCCESQLSLIFRKSILSRTSNHFPKVDSVPALPEVTSFSKPN